MVSVPTRGLFNLTMDMSTKWYEKALNSFRPHQGIV